MSKLAIIVALASAVALAVTANSSAGPRPVRPATLPPNGTPAFTVRGKPNLPQGMTAGTVAASPNFTGKWTGDYTGVLYGNRGCSGYTYPISGGLTITLAQTGASLPVTFSLVGGRVAWDGSCRVTGYSDDSFTINTTVSGASASGNGASLKMSPDLASLTGSFQGAGGKLTFTVHRTVPTHHYRVELKAWIPQSAVVDPARPIRAPWHAADLGCFTPPADVAGRTFVESTYRGDGHTNYDGLYRVLAWVEFDWNGSTITNVTQGGLYGVTYNDIVYEMPGGLNQQCSRSGQATSSAYGDANGSTFGLRISSANPLTVPQSLTPNIDSKLDGSISSTGALTLRYQTDQFPSHGFRVIEDGKTIATDVVTNVACLKPLGMYGFALLLKRLNLSEPAGTVTVSQTSSSTEKIASCN